MNKPIPGRAFLRRSAALPGTSALAPGGNAGWPDDSTQASPRTRGGLTISLDDAWRVADIVSADELPKIFTHSAPVPGMANLATLPFPVVAGYLSRENITVRSDFDVRPESELAGHIPGPKQTRNFFWCEKTFEAPAKREVEF